MTDDDIIRMAREADREWDCDRDMCEWIKHFAELVAAHEREKYEKDAARWQALKTVNGRVQWYWHEGDAIVANEAWSSDFGGLDQAMDAWIEKARQP